MSRNVIDGGVHGTPSVLDSTRERERDMSISKDGGGPGDWAQATVYIVDDNEELCSVLRRHIEKQGLSCRIFHNAEQFLEGYDPSVAGCLVLDVRMPGMNGLELQERLRSHGDMIPILILTGHADVNTVLRAWRNEASEFLQKPVSNHTLLEHIRAAVRKDLDARRSRARRDECLARINTLTKRETEVMNLVVAGRANKVVGKELGLSQKTVEVHRSNVMKKMAARSFAELVQMVMIAKGGPGSDREGEKQA